MCHNEYYDAEMYWLSYNINLSIGSWSHWGLSLVYWVYSQWSRNHTHMPIRSANASKQQSPWSPKRHTLASTFATLQFRLNTHLQNKSSEGNKNVFCSLAKRDESMAPGRSKNGHLGWSLAVKIDGYQGWARKQSHSGHGVWWSSVHGEPSIM